MSARKSSHRTIFLIVSSGSPLALIASSLRSTSKKPFCPMTRSLHPPITACAHRVRFVGTWREEFFEAPWNRIDGKSHHTPLSDRLFGIFTEWSKSFAGLLPDFELMFERFEMLGALAHLEQNKATDVVAELNKNEFVWIPLGRAAWHSQNREKLIAEIQSEPMKAALVKAGFAQSNPAFVELFIRNFKFMAANLGW